MVVNIVMPGLIAAHLGLRSKRRMANICTLANMAKHANEGAQPAGMTDKPATTYVVSVFETPNWRTVLTTKDEQEAFDIAKEIGDKVRIEEITPKSKKR
ncbi:hypothetical protein MesoLj113a_18330 [Mesorhizobium sp. 113-1-2]|nr:hypothetical protein MLTONO_2589 [Mesorhizobium loti]BCG70675.1 hypothetical protein MesoLj113a_18330 [Mesorhizobium sp. 113-1-2]